MTRIIIIFIILLVISIGVVFLIKFLKNQKKDPSKQNNYNFQGAAYNNILMYKSRQDKFIGVILNKYDKFTNETLFKNIDDITLRLIKGQNNGLISQAAFEKTALDNILLQMPNMTKVDVSIINYEMGYMSVAVIFENNNKDLYQLLMKINVQNGLLYLDSYNATLWFKNE